MSNMQTKLTNYNNTRQFLHTLNYKQLAHLREAMINGSLTLTQIETAYDAVRDAYEWSLIKNK